MLEHRCQRCGGSVGNPAGTTYREASNATPSGDPPGAACSCGAPPLYRPAHERSLWERQGGGVHRLRSASRN